MNIAMLKGTLVAEPRVTELATGTVVHNYELRTVADGNHQVVPVAWYDPTRPPALDADDEVVVVGVVRRRWFRAGAGSHSRTEVVARAVARAGSRRATRLLDEAHRRFPAADSCG